MNGFRVGEIEVRRPEICSLSRLFWVGVIFALHVGTQHHASAAPHVVTVRGQAHFTAEVRRDADRVVVRGTLADDADEPIANAEIGLSLSQSSIALTTCNEPRGPSRGKLRGNERGQFCVSTRGELDRAAVLRLSFAGTDWVDGTAKEVELGRAHRTLQLRPETADIKAVAGEQVTVTVIAREGAASASGVKLVLVDEQDAALGRAETDGAGKATISVTNSGAPGTGTWVIRADGDDVWYPAEARLTTTRTTVATLSAPPTVRIWDQTGTEFLVVGVACRFPVSGTAELWLGGERLGATPILNNTTTIPFESSSLARHTGKAEVRLRPTSEQVLANPIAVAIDTRPRQALRALGILGGIVVLCVFAFGRSATLRRRFERAFSRRVGRVRGSRSGASLAETMTTARRSGRIVDSYSNKPISGAQIRSIDVTFSEQTERACARSNHQGEFEVYPGLHQALRWEIAASGYRTREVTNNELSCVRLRKRKHALVEDLVEWARAIGSPFDQKPEPTPGHVANIAGPVGKTAVWARAVESAAFSPGDIDEAHEEELRRSLPRVIPPADDPNEDVR